MNIWFIVYKPFCIFYIFIQHCTNLFVCHSSITVVQSYFVYWAGIESAVVHDGSHSPWTGSNITGVDGGNSISAPQEDEVTALPGMQLVRC